MPGQPEIVGGIPIIGNGGVMIDTMPDDSPVEIDGTQMGVHRALTIISISTSKRVQELQARCERVETKLDEVIGLLTALAARED